MKKKILRTMGEKSYSLWHFCIFWLVTLLAYDLGLRISYAQQLGMIFFFILGMIAAAHVADYYDKTPNN